MLIKIKRFAFVIVGCLLVLSMLFTACTTQSNGEQEEEEEEEGFKVAAIMAGTVDDAGFYIQAKMACETLSEYPEIEVAEYIEYVAMPDSERVMRRYADEGYDLLWAHGGEYRETVLKVAPDVPELSLSTLTGGPIDDIPENVWNVMAYYHEAYYVAGAAAGLATKTNKIGWVGGMPFPTYTSAFNGFKAGVESINPDAEVLVTFIGSFDDATAAYEATLAQMEEGADVIVHSVDLAVYGVVEAIQETDVLMIGMGMDQRPLAPDSVLTSVLIKYHDVYVEITERTMEGEKGDEILFSLVSGHLELTSFNGHLTPEQEATVAQVKEDILSGNIEVPLIFEL